MEERKRTLVILLSMHRTGSSLTAHILQRLGMSLGPFELNGSAPSNPYGHFESIPFLDLNRQIQDLAYGFPDDLPESPELLARFLEKKGAWDAALPIPADLLAAGRSLIQCLWIRARSQASRIPAPF